MASTAEKATMVKARVRDLFIRFPETKDNYAMLVLRYWAEYDDPRFRDFIYILGEKVKALTSPEGPPRAAREIQNTEGAFKPTQDLVEKRRRKEAEMKKHFREQKRLEESEGREEDE